jgi:protein O-mannosyl-transferase
VGMLVPVIGLVQVGQQAMADRYTYLPEIGLAIALTWGAKGLLGSGPFGVRLGGAASALVLVALTLGARQQTSYWRDSETLWNRALACNSENAVAHWNLGRVLCDQGHVAESIEHLQEALRIRPDFAEVYNNLGVACAKQQKFDDANAYYQKALKLNPDHAKAHANFGTTLYRQGRVAEAIAEFQSALDLNPDDVAAHSNLGAALASQGRFDEAIDHYRKALNLAVGQNNAALASTLRARIKLCQDGSPHREN